MAFAGSWVRATDVGIFFACEVLSLARDKGRRRSTGQQCLTFGAQANVPPPKLCPQKEPPNFPPCSDALNLGFGKGSWSSGKVDIQHELTKDEYHAFLHPNQDRDSYAGKGQVFVCFR